MLRYLIPLCVFAFWSTFATAFELRIASNALEAEVREISLIAALEGASPPAQPQDVIAAAQADYARLVGLLFDRGYFAPVVSIRINTREASEISPVQPPPQVRNVDINVQTGKQFSFGTARIAPLAPEF